MLLGAWLLLLGPGCGEDGGGAGTGGQIGDGGANGSGGLGGDGDGTGAVVGDGDGDGDGDGTGGLAGDGDGDGDGDDTGPDCQEGTVGCNGECLSTVGQQAGNCTLLARVEGVEAMAVGPDGDLYTVNSPGYDGTNAGAYRIPVAGGDPVALSSEQRVMTHMFVEADAIYFLTGEEMSDVRTRRTGSIGRIDLPAGETHILVSDVPNGSFAKTATHFYVGAEDDDPGLRRFDLTGGDETLLTGSDVASFVVGGDTAYLVVDRGGYEPLHQLPLAGGDPTPLGDGACLRVLGVTDSHVIAHCERYVRIDRSTGAETRLFDPSVFEAGTGNFEHMRGKHLVFSHELTFGYRRSIVYRADVETGALQALAEVTEEGSKQLIATAAGDDAVYAFVFPGFLVDDARGFVLKIDVTP